MFVQSYYRVSPSQTGYDRNPCGGYSNDADSARKKENTKKAVEEER